MWGVLHVLEDDLGDREARLREAADASTAAETTRTQASSANAARVRFSGSPSVHTTSSSMRTPP